MGERKMLVLEIVGEAHAIKSFPSLLQGQPLLGKQLHEVEVERVVDIGGNCKRQSALSTEGAEKPSSVEISRPPCWTDSAAAQKSSLILCCTLVVHDTADHLNLACGHAPRQPTRAGGHGWGRTSKFVWPRPTRSASGRGKAESQAAVG